MCREVTIRRETLDGELLVPPVTLDDPPVLCTCWLGMDADGDTHVVQDELDQLHKWLLDALKPILREGMSERVVIELA